MTTDQATRRLGRILEYGQDDTATPSKAEGLIRVAQHHGRATNWAKAAQALRDAYRSLGAEHPETETNPGYLWHCGDHPIQVAAAAEKHEMDMMLGED